MTRYVQTAYIRLVSDEFPTCFAGRNSNLASINAIMRHRNIAFANYACIAQGENNAVFTKTSKIVLNFHINNPET